MKSSRYTVAQIAFAMRQAESGTPVPEVCRKMGIAENIVATRKPFDLHSIVTIYPHFRSAFNS